MRIPESATVPGLRYEWPPGRDFKVPTQIDQQVRCQRGCGCQADPAVAKGGASDPCASQWQAVSNARHICQIAAFNAFSTRAQVQIHGAHGDAQRQRMAR